MEEKKRKPRKDKGKKRVKRIKNPKLQTGKLEFKHIGTNLTSLIGAYATTLRNPVMMPSQPQAQMSNELIVRQPQETMEIKATKPRPVVSENVNTESIRRAMGSRIQHIREEHEKEMVNIEEQYQQELKKNQQEKKKEVQSELIKRINKSQASQLAELVGLKVSEAKAFASEKSIEELRKEAFKKQGLDVTVIGQSKGANIYGLKSDIERGQEEKPVEIEGGGGGLFQAEEAINDIAKALKPSSNPIAIDLAPLINPQHFEQFNEETKVAQELKNVLMKQAESSKSPRTMTPRGMAQIQVKAPPVKEKKFKIVFAEEEED